jgi:exodeoxyribonuclease VII large subunit
LNQPFIEETYAVSRLCADIHDLLAEALPEVWVSGELQRYSESRAGHAYMELVEKGDDDQIVGKLSAVIWRGDMRRIRPSLARAGQALADGQEIRCRGRVDFYPAGGRLQLMISEVDPTFTLGRLELARRETLEALRQAGLLEANKSLELPSPPLDLALITSADSAAFHDFMSTLQESGYGFRVHFIHASVQGAAAEREVVSALKAAAALPVDCIALVRGGGARSDLAVFDARAVAETVARCSRPVLAGLGHQIDQSVVDQVAHTSLKTPTKAAESLVERVRTCEADLDRIATDLRHHSLGHLRRVREWLGRSERGFEMVALRLVSRRQRLEHLTQSLVRAAGVVLDRQARSRQALGLRLAEAAPRLLSRSARQPHEVGPRIARAAQRRLATATERLEGYARVRHTLSPERTLQRGFSITLDEQGQVLRSAAGAAAGTRITSRLADGELISRVEER